MSLAQYLAKNYLTASSGPAKKRKHRRLNADSQSGLTIADDDALGWHSGDTVRAGDDRPITVDVDSAEFRKAKNSKWQSIGTPAPTTTDQAAADAILTSTATESLTRSIANNDIPIVDDQIPMMESGAHGGLQTADQLTAQIEQKKTIERRRSREDGHQSNTEGTETIYRDASGRIINVVMMRAEARKKMVEEAAKVAAASEEQKGDVQRARRQERKNILQEAKYLPTARYADDVKLNEELKDKVLWNDPGADFMRNKVAGKSDGGRPLYSGTATPNRYGIRPGYRWDGVDRGTGFERSWFGARNRKQDLGNLHYAWQMDE